MDSHSTQNTNRDIGKITELGNSVFEVSPEKPCFSEPTLKSVSKLAEVLKRIDKRMKREGFVIKNGIITKV